MQSQSRGNSNAGPEAGSFSLDPKSFYDHCWGQNYMYLKSVFEWQHIVNTLIFSQASLYFKHLSLDQCEKHILASDHSVFLAPQLLFRCVLLPFTVLNHSLFSCFYSAVNSFLLQTVTQNERVEKSKWSWFPKMCGGGLTYSVYVWLFDRVRQIPQLLSIIWNSNCSEADNTFCSPHNCTGGKNNILLSAHSPWGVCLLNMCAVLWKRLLCMFVPMYVQKELFFFHS